MLDKLNQTKCIFGSSVESLITAIAMPKFYLPNVTVINDLNEEVNARAAIMSRNYLTKVDIVFWNNFLKLFGPKEISNVDSYIEKVPLYIRSHGKIVNLGCDSVYKNMESLIRKNFFLFRSETVSRFLSMNEEDINVQFDDLVNLISEDSFYEDKLFMVNFERWLKKQNPVTLFFKMFISDAGNFFKTKDGIKLWRQLPSLYFSEFDYSPSVKSVAKFLFYLIQPVYFFNSSKMMTKLKDYLNHYKVTVEDTREINASTEGNKILHIKTEKQDPIRTDAYWELPWFKLNTDENSLCSWNWRSSSKSDFVNNKLNKLIVYDFNGFMFDKHYFSGIGFYVNNQIEFNYLQNFAFLPDKQLFKKIPEHFKNVLLGDKFWSDIKQLSTNDKLDISSFDFCELRSNFFYNEFMQGKKYFWKEVSTMKSLNYRSLKFDQKFGSYWTSFLHMLTKTLWSEFYKAKF